MKACRNLREYCEEDEVYNGVDNSPGDVEEGEEEGREQIEPVISGETQHHQPVTANIKEAPKQCKDCKSLEENIFINIQMSPREITESQGEECDNGVHHPQHCQEYRGVLDSLMKI